MEWSFVEKSRNVHELRFNAPVGEPLEVLLISDLHWDSPQCDRKALRRHLDQAKEKNSPVIVAGDLYDAMGGKWDKRADKSMLRPEHQAGNYLDMLVTTAAEWFQPYSQQLVLVGQGNHETAMRRAHETDLVERLCTLLQAGGGVTRAGGYGGWVRIIGKGMSDGGNAATRSIRLYYHHGFGGGGPVTRGAIDFSRYILNVDAEVIVSGHIHRRERSEVWCDALSDASKQWKKQRLFLRCSTYKDGYGDGHGGWENERNHGPRPIGGWWMKVTRRQDGRLLVTSTETD